MSFNLLGFSFFNMTEKEIRRRVMMGLIRGSGTKDDPFFFTDLSSLPTYISFFGVKSHILIDGGMFEHIILKWCRNIHIRNSKVVTISLEHSTDIVVENTIFLALNLKRSLGNIYRNNENSPAVKFTFEKKQRLFPLGDVVELMMISTVIGMFFFVMFLFLFFPLFFAFFLFIAVFICCMGFTIFRKHIRMIRYYLLIRNKRDIIENNQFAPKDGP